MHDPNTWANEISTNLPNLKIKQHVPAPTTTLPPVEKVKDVVAGAALFSTVFLIPEILNAFIG